MTNQDLKQKKSMRSIFLKSYKQSLFLVLSFFSLVAAAQEKEGSAKLADQKFLAGNFEGALEEYEALLKNVDNRKFNYRLAICYLNTNIDKKKAIPLLEEVIAEKKFDENALYLLGRAYHFAERYDDAIKMYIRFKDSGKGSPENLKNVDKQVEYCYNAKELIKFPLNITFENLGKNVNSEFPDYYPFIAQDESFLIYNSRKDEEAVLGVDGKYTANVFMSVEKGGKWQKAKSIGLPVNTTFGDEEVAGMTPDGKTIVFHYDNNISSGDLFIGNRYSTGFTKPEILHQHINSKAFEIAAAISADGTTLYFASDRPGGLGGTDLYRSQKLPSGVWSEAFNLGPSVNTTFDEDFPTLSFDGKTLYFSSKGHTSMGGYDIFRASWDSITNGWTGVKNMGYPLNTPDDNMNLCMSESGRYGYISAFRDGGVGDLDIYRVTFNDVEPKYTVMKGLISSNDAYTKVGQVSISVYDKNSGDLFGSYLPNPASGRYIMILPPGKYSIEIEADGFKKINEDVVIVDKASFQTTIEKDIKLLAP